MRAGRCDVCLEGRGWRLVERRAYSRGCGVRAGRFDLYDDIYISSFDRALIVLASEAVANLIGPHRCSRGPPVCFCGVLGISVHLSAVLSVTSSHVISRGL